MNQRSLLLTRNGIIDTASETAAVAATSPRAPARLVPYLQNLRQTGEEFKVPL